MKRDVLRYLLLISFFSIVAGCGSGSDGSGNQTRPGLYTDMNTDVDGVSRSFDYYLPDNLGNQPRPLVFLLHGGGSDPEDLTGMSGYKAPYKAWMTLSDEEKIVLVYPEGMVNPKGELGWNDCRGDATTNPDVDDVAFIDILIEKFASNHNIDLNRVYSTGTSNGGHMSLRLALELGSRVAAVAPVVAAMPGVNSCTSPAHPISILFMNGTTDPILPYNGGEVAPDIGGRGNVLSTQASIEYWVNFNQTATTPSVEGFPDLNLLDGSSVSRHLYAHGREGVEVVLYEVNGGGHTEPSIEEQYSAFAELYLGRQNHDIEMAREIWNFFKTKTL